MKIPARIVAGCLIVMIVTFVLVPYDRLDFIPATIGPFGPIPRTDFSDIARFGGFLLVGGAIATVFPRHIPSAMLVAIALCAGLEIVQSYMPGRHGRFPDFAVKASGVAAGVALWHGVKETKRRLRKAVSKDASP